MPVPNTADSFVPANVPGVANARFISVADTRDESDSALAALPAAAVDPWIFRDGRKTISGLELLSKLRVTLSGSGPDSVADALIQAGELEAGIADAEATSSRAAVMLTDALASAICTKDSSHLLDAQRLIDQLHVPEELSISPPEGFTYYALHPLSFSRVVDEFPAEGHLFAVLGIRSIGTTLGAVVTAALKHVGRTASRITVRPKGHPYAREATFSTEEKRWIHEQQAAGAHFIVVDEGPGRSGSTFLSVAESLLHEGVSRPQVTLIGSREADPNSLLATNGASRWKQFHFVAAQTCARFTEHLYAGGGTWREILLPSEQSWPESWCQMERLKFISPVEQEFIKFEGMGRIGSETRSRAFALAEAGFGPSVREARAGFLSYELARGKSLAIANLDRSLLKLMASYCTFRVRNFRTGMAGPSELERMVNFNLLQEFGLQVRFPKDTFATSNPVIVDGKMQPHEWLVGGPHGFLKTDGTSHGDDHFFPGPCDIAWDLAGLAIEWQMQSTAIEYLISEFERLSGEADVASRLPAYMLAYCVFRSSFCKMGSQSVGDTNKNLRLGNAYLHFRATLEDILQRNFSEQIVYAPAR